MPTRIRSPHRTRRTRSSASATLEEWTHCCASQRIVNPLGSPRTGTRSTSGRSPSWISCAAPRSTAPSRFRQLPLSGGNASIMSLRQNRSFLETIEDAVLDGLHGRSICDGRLEPRRGRSGRRRRRHSGAARPPRRAHAAPRQRALYALFFDNSTRTKSSWAGAAVRLGIHPVIVDGSSTQVAHGETAAETGAMLGMNAHALGIRHDLILGEGNSFMRDVKAGSTTTCSRAATRAPSPSSTCSATSTIPRRPSPTSVAARAISRRPRAARRSPCPGPTRRVTPSRCRCRRA